MIFLQVVASLKWLDSLAAGDISAAFLQGRDRSSRDASLPPLYMEQPRGRPLPGLQPGQLIQVIKGVFGLPDAPRAWWEEFSSTIRSYGLVSTKLDPAFFVYRGQDGAPKLLLIVHVDDILVAHDGSDESRRLQDRIRTRYPFGDWKVAIEHPGGVSYCGRTVEVRTVAGIQEAYVQQRPFIESRLETIELTPARAKELEQPVTAVERSEFKSVLGSLQWVVSMTRPDLAYEVNCLQRRQSCPLVKHLIGANRLVREALSTAEVGIRVRPIADPMVVVYSDSSLCNSAGDPVDGETYDQVARAEQEKVRSQIGVLVVIASAQSEDVMEAIPCTIVDWRTTASKRVVYSTFAAETSACTVGVGSGLFVRTLLAEVLHGRCQLPPEQEESRVALRVVTDCKSLYDNVQKEGSVPACRWTAIFVAALREVLSAGPGRDLMKAGLRWCPSREQQSDGLTKSGLSESMRSTMEESTIRLHEESAQSLKRRSQLGSNTHSTDVVPETEEDM